MTFDARPFTVNVVTTPFWLWNPFLCHNQSFETVTSLPLTALISSAACCLLRSEIVSVATCICFMWLLQLVLCGGGGIFMFPRNFLAPVCFPIANIARGKRRSTSYVFLHFFEVMKLTSWWHLQRNVNLKARDVLVSVAANSRLAPNCSLQAGHTSEEMKSVSSSQSTNLNPESLSSHLYQSQHQHLEAHFEALHEMKMKQRMMKIKLWLGLTLTTRSLGDLRSSFISSPMRRLKFWSSLISSVLIPTKTTFSFPIITWSLSISHDLVQNTQQRTQEVTCG